MSDEKAHRKKEDEKVEVKTWSQTQEVGMSDEKTYRKKEADKAKVGAWNQTQEAGMFDEKAQHKKEEEKAKVELVLRYSCDVCEHTSKTNEQLKKHMTIAHK